MYINLQNFTHYSRILFNPETTLQKTVEKI